MPENRRTPLRAEGGRIVDANGNEVLITGVNWFGLETQAFAPGGLHTRKWTDLLDQVVDLGFNALRLPYSSQLLHPEIKPHDVDPNLTPDRPGGIHAELNPDLVGLTGPQIMDTIVDGATSRGLMVILDRHRPDCLRQSNLWHNEDFSEEIWISDWVALATKFRDNPLVIGADLHNEPHDHADNDPQSRQPSVTWGDDNPGTDWRAAAQRAGNAVLAVNPNWLIFVEGVQSFRQPFLPEERKAFYFFGGNLAPARERPVVLTDPSKLVYSAHDYGPGVFHQRWFDDPIFPANMPGLWRFMWAYLVEEERAPVLIGEFGGKSVDPTANELKSRLEGIWQHTLVNYLRDNRISYTYFTLNPDSVDTGGVLDNDFKTVRRDKMNLLSTHLAPRLAVPVPA